MARPALTARASSSSAAARFAKPLVTRRLGGGLPGSGAGAGGTETVTTADAGAPASSSALSDSTSRPGSLRSRACMMVPPLPVSVGESSASGAGHRPGPHHFASAAAGAVL